LIVEYQEFYWLVIQVVEERCHISQSTSNICFKTSVES